LGFLTGVRHRPEDLELAFFSTRFTRVLDASDSARLKHRRIYGEEGLARREVPLWLGPEVFTVEFAGDTLACYGVVEYSSGTGTATDGARGHLREVKKPWLFATRHRSTQLRLFKLDAPGENGWLKALNLDESMYLASCSSPLLCSRRFCLRRGALADPAAIRWAHPGPWAKKPREKSEPTEHDSPIRSTLDEDRHWVYCEHMLNEMSI